MPLLDNYSDMEHSYIVELKYAKSKDTETRIKQLTEQAIEQVNRYAETDKVKASIKTTQLHKLVIVYQGTQMVVCKEIK